MFYLADAFSFLNLTKLVSYTYSSHPASQNIISLNITYPCVVWGIFLIYKLLKRNHQGSIIARLIITHIALFTFFGKPLQNLIP